MLTVYAGELPGQLSLLDYLEELLERMSMTAPMPPDDQPALFGPDGEPTPEATPGLLGEALKAAGMADASSSAAAQDWRTDADAALGRLLAAGQPFTADDLVQLAGLPSAGINANNAVGAFVNAAARRGLIVKAGYRKSLRAAAHARIVAVWLPTGKGLDLGRVRP